MSDLRQLLSEAYVVLKRSDARIDQLERYVHSLSDCVRDGIEKNYSSWEDWSSVARAIYNNIRNEESNN